MNTTAEKAVTTVQKAVGKLLCEWEVFEIIKTQADYFKESGDYTDKSDDELFQLAAGDSDNFAFEWEYLCEYLTELMAKNRHGGWKAMVNNFGWRELDGRAVFHATTGKELLQAVLPDTECTFRVYRYGRGFAINNAHHDSPYWREWYYISPCKEAQAA